MSGRRQIPAFLNGLIQDLQKVTVRADRAQLSHKLFLSIPYPKGSNHENTKHSFKYVHQRSDPV